VNIIKKRTFTSVSFIFIIVIIVSLLFNEVVLGEGGDVLSSPFTISGYLSLYYYYSNLTGKATVFYPEQKSAMVFDVIHLYLDAKRENIGFHVDYAVSDEPYGGAYGDNWAEEAYIFYKTSIGSTILGLSYVPFGIFWDGTWYGSLMYFKGFMLDADWGLKFSGGKNNFDFNAAFYTNGDGLNGEALLGSGPEVGTNQEDMFVGRLVYTQSVSEDINLTIGVSGLRGKVVDDIAGTEVDETDFEADVTFDIGKFTLAGQYVNYERGDDDSGKGNIFYIMLNANVIDNPGDKFFNRLSIYYNYSRDSPNDSSDGLSDLRIAGANLTLAHDLSVYLEYVRWKVGKILQNNTFYCVFYIFF